MRPKGRQVLLVLWSLSVAGCGEKHAGANVCPVDGQAPQWVGEQKGDSCEYFHYSDLERKTHSWWADCKLRSVK